MPEESTQKVPEKKKRRVNKKLLRLIIIAAVAVIIIVCVIIFIILYYKYRTFSSYSTTSTIDLSSSSDNISYSKFSDGYVKCTNSGITYFNEGGIVWDENFDMDQPVLDINGNYVAVSDMKQSDIYLYGTSGLVKRFSTTHDILDVEVAKNGVTAISSSDGTSNYIELFDKDGNQLVNARSVFSSSGYLMDIDLSSDGTQLVAAFTGVTDGSLESKVLFYDFSSNDDSEKLKAGFNQYDDSIITNVEFMKNNIVCAVGDNALTFYKCGSTPEIVYEELNMDWEIQSLYINDDYVLAVTKDTSGNNNYYANVYDTSGNKKAGVGFDFSYSTASLAGTDIVLYSSNSCQIYSFGGVKRLSYTFDDRIEALLYCGSGNKYIYASLGNAQFINFK